jgi:hypothetical protein
VNADNKEHVFESTDTGQQDWQDLGFADAASGTFDLYGDFVLCHDNGIYELDPGASAFNNKGGNLNTVPLYSISLAPTLAPNNADFVYGTAQDFPGTLQYTGSQVWQYNQPPYNTFESGKIAVDPVNPKVIYYLDPDDNPSPMAVPNDRFAYSEDGGQTWTAEVSGLPWIPKNGVAIKDTAFYGKNALVMDPTNSARLLLGLHSVYETTTDGVPNTAEPIYHGNGWRDMGAGMGNNGQTITAIAIDPFDPNTVYAGTIDGHIYATNSDGYSTTYDMNGWHKADNGLPVIDGAGRPQTIMDIKVNPADPSILFAVTSSYVGRDDKAPFLYGVDHVWMSLDKGAHWFSIQGNLPQELGGECLAIDSNPQPNGPSILYLGTQRGVFSWSRGLATWTRMDSLPRTRVTDLDFVPELDLLGAATLGRGAYVMSVDAPAPKSSYMSQSTIVAFSPSSVLTVYGTHFVYDSSVEVNGRPVSTTFVNTGQLQASIDSSFFKAAGTLNITVFTPGPGGGTSDPLPLKVIAVPPPPPPPPPPLVTVTKVVDTLNNKHQVIEIDVIFSGLVNSAEADSLATYRLAKPGKKNSYTARNAGVIRLSRAVYAASTNTVALAPRKPFTLTKPVQVLVYGTGASALQDSAGRDIDGDDNGTPGGNAMAILSKNSVTLAAAPLARTSGKTAMSAAVDTLLKRGDLAGLRHGLHHPGRQDKR